jgi:signal transduction histidine kinase
MDRRTFGLEHVALAATPRSLVAVAVRPGRGSADREATSSHGLGRAGDASHDLRQPLNVMLGYAQLLLDRHLRPMLPASSARSVGTIERHARELLRLLTGALDLVRSSARRTPPSSSLRGPEVLRELCTGSLADRAPGAVALRLARGSDDPDAPEPTAFAWRQVLQNLIDNALSPHRARRGRRRPPAPHDRGVALQVSDTGSGIAPTTCPRLRAASDRQPGRTGSGLGLYIVKRFCESLGGEVSVASTLGTARVHGGSADGRLAARVTGHASAR